tara:strand:- start:1646 stop:2152 length:507 start_codon:yes stop_codon:yes gene_type:complete
VAFQEKIVSLTSGRQTSTIWKERGETVVFTNGCFDILHVGHVSYLSKAAELGSKLIVGINSDQSVKRLEKGVNRPINNEDSRAILLAALEFIDLVIVFDTDTPLEMIESLNPNVLVKGGDYDAQETDSDSKKYIVGSSFVLKNDGKVSTIDLVDGFSTTSIIDKMKND